MALGLHEQLEIARARLRTSVAAPLPAGEQTSLVEERDNALWHLVQMQAKYEIDEELERLSGLGPGPATPTSRGGSVNQPTSAQWQVLVQDAQVLRKRFNDEARSRRSAIRHLIGRVTASGAPQHHINELTATLLKMGDTGSGLSTRLRKSIDRLVSVDNELVQACAERADLEGLLSRLTDQVEDPGVRPCCDTTPAILFRRIEHLQDTNRRLLQEADYCAWQKSSQMSSHTQLKHHKNRGVVDESLNEKLARMQAELRVAELKQSTAETALAKSNRALEQVMPLVVKLFKNIFPGDRRCKPLCVHACVYAFVSHC